jgi:hypothetical protein
MFASCLHATQVATPGSSAPAIASSAADRSVVQLGQVAVSAIAEADSRWQTITLHRHGAEGNAIAVTLGIPFPPHMLRVARRVLILD